MNKTELVAAIAEKAEISKKDSEKALKAFIDVVSDQLKKGDKVLFIDDFLANGEAFKGTENLIAQAQAEIVGVGMVIEKAFQKGHAYIAEKGYDLLALASIAGVKNKKITWADE